MPRVVIPSSAVSGDAATVTDPEALHHLLDVLRVKVGDRLECFDGKGRGYRGPVIRRSRRELVIAIAERMEEPPSPVGITVAQAWIRPERFEWMIQKAVELGVERISPLLTERSRAHPGPDQMARRLARWRRIAQEAAAQCGRTLVPHVEDPQSVEAFLQQMARGTVALMPTLVGAAPPLKEEMSRLNEAPAIAILIGPEGDFTEAEVALAERAGARPVSLGRLTLRSETAAIATLAILQHAVGGL